MKATLEQWQTLIAVVDEGGFAQAAEALRKSQSAISYAISKLEAALGVAVFKIDGRKAVLTAPGEALLRHARQLVENAERIETLADYFTQGWEPEIRIAMDTIFPEDLMLSVLNAFANEHPQIRITLVESALSGTDEALLRHEADLVIGGHVPPGFTGQFLLNIQFLAVAHPAHPLHQHPTPLTLDDLKSHRQLVVKDSGSRRLDAGWLGAHQRWTFSSVHTSIKSACQGLGFAWYPTLKIEQPLKAGNLKPLPLLSGAVREVPIYLILSDGEYAHPGVKRLANLLKTVIQNCLQTKKA